MPDNTILVNVRFVCHSCGGAGLTQALTRCASCAGAGGWSLAALRRCERCGGRMHADAQPLADGALELSCLACGHRRYVQVMTQLI